MSVIKKDAESSKNTFLVIYLLLSSAAILYLSILSYSEDVSRSDLIRGVYMKWAQGDTRDERDVAETFMRCLSRSVSVRGSVSAMPKLDDCLRLAGNDEFAKEVREAAKR